MADSGEIMRDYANFKMRAVDQAQGYTQRGLDAFARFGETAVPNMLAIQRQQQEMQMRDVQATAELETNALQRQKLQGDLQFAAQLHNDDFMNLQKREAQARVAALELEVDKARTAWDDERQGQISVMSLTRNADFLDNYALDVEGSKARVRPLTDQERAQRAQERQNSNSWIDQETNRFSNGKNQKNGSAAQTAGQTGGSPQTTQVATQSGPSKQSLSDTAFSEIAKREGYSPDTARKIADKMAEHVLDPASVAQFRQKVVAYGNKTFATMSDEEVRRKLWQSLMEPEIFSYTIRDFAGKAGLVSSMGPVPSGGGR
jgi:hypothetical protein